MDPSFTVADWGHDASLRDTIRCVHSRRKIEGDHVVSNIFAYPECTTASNSPSTKYTDDEPGLRQLDDTGGTVLTGPPVRRSQVESPRPQNIVNKGLSEEGSRWGYPWCGKNSEMLRCLKIITVSSWYLVTIMRPHHLASRDK